MANNERLTKRVKKIEEWVAENDDMGGPKGYMDTMVSMYQSNVNLTASLNNLNQNYGQMREFTFEFIQEHKLEDEWNEFLAEKEKLNAVQKQTAEEVSTLTETKDGEEVGEEDTKGKEPSKEEKSKETKK